MQAGRYPAERVLVVGEALLDVTDGERRPGGSPMNVAVGLARLGIPTVLHTALGRDDGGSLIAQHVRASGVELTAESWRDGATSVAEVTLDDAGSAQYRFDIAWEPGPFAVSPGAYGAVHVGSIAAIMPPGASVVADILAASRSTALLTYDPNIRPSLVDSRTAARERVEDLVARIDVVKASDEDIAFLYPELSADEVLDRWSALGAAVAVLTAGARGACIKSGKTIVDVPAAPVAVRDTVGAGDSFMAGLLWALRDRGLLNATGRRDLASLGAVDLRQLLSAAIRCASITVTRDGADPPWLADVLGPQSSPVHR